MKFFRENLAYILIPFFLVIASALGVYVYMEYIAEESGTAAFVYTF